MTSTLQLCKALIARPSVSPADEGCQELLIAELNTLGFTVEKMPIVTVTNIWTTRSPSCPVLCLAGQTDVVPAGNSASWNTEPFRPTIKDGLLFRRGAAEMKGSIAAMMTACRNFISAHPDHNGTLAFLITS